MRSIAYILLEKGVDANCRDKDGKVAADYMEYTHFDQDLKDALADQKSSSFDGRTQSKDSDILESIFAIKSAKSGAVSSITQDWETESLSDIVSFDIDEDQEISIASERLGEVDTVISLSVLKK
jgi:hypothetical protein